MVDLHVGGDGLIADGDGDVAAPVSYTHLDDLTVSSLLRKESPCATIIKCIGASSHSGKGASEWVKVYERCV